MGRKSKAQIIIEELKEEEEQHPDARYIIVYDFEAGNNPNKFYENLHRLFTHYRGYLVQRSIVEVFGSKGGKAIETLAKSYGADVLRYRVIEEIE